MKVTGYPSIDKPHEKGYSHFATLIVDKII